MCRHVGYIGKKDLLDRLLLKKKSHSLIEMAFKPKEMENAILNADGFGIGWNFNKQFYLYKNHLPIWNDQNLFSISSNLSSDLVIANVRSATFNGDVNFNSSHPFKFDNFLFSHNGFIKDFDKGIKEKIIRYLEPEILVQIKGHTDSEYIFFLLIQIYKKVKNITKAILDTIKFLSNICDGLMLNLLLAVIDKNNLKLYGTKFAKSFAAPSLYYLLDNKKNIYISSEPLDKQDWKSVNNLSLLECSKNQINIFSI